MAVQRHTRGLPGDPLQQLLEAPRPRLRLHQDRGWADAGLSFSAEAGLADLPREGTLVVPSAPPWENVGDSISFGLTTTIPTKRSDPPEERLRAVEDTLAGLPPADFTVYTDGSASGGVEFGGGGAVVYRGEQELQKIRVPAGRHTSSYRAELMALDAALEYLQRAARDAPRAEVRLCTDSQSALRRLARGPAARSDMLADRVWARLRALADGGLRLRLQWVPGHAGLPGNELADEVARAAAELDQGAVPVDLCSAKSKLRRRAFDEWEERLRPTRYWTENGPRRVTPGERLGLTRRESVEMARLRTGHSTLLAVHNHRIGTAHVATCPECGESDESLHHLLADCPARAAVRRAVFGRDDPTTREALEDLRRLVDLLVRLGRL